MKNLAMLPSYFHYIFLHRRQKARLRPELSPKFLSTLGPNPGPTYNSDLVELRVSDQRLLIPGSIPEPAMRRCVFGKTLRMFSIRAL